MHSLVSAAATLGMLPAERLHSRLERGHGHFLRPLISTSTVRTCSLGSGSYSRSRCRHCTLPQRRPAGWSSVEQCVCRCGRGVGTIASAGQQQAVKRSQLHSPCCGHALPCASSSSVRTHPCHQPAPQGPQARPPLPQIRPPAPKRARAPLSPTSTQNPLSSCAHPPTNPAPSACTHPCHPPGPRHSSGTRSPQTGRRPRR